MGAARSKDLRERVVAEVAAGMSRRQAAVRFVNRRPSLTPDRRSILTRLAPAFAVARRRSVEPLAERNA
jgi:hypothetical protein